MKSICAQIHSPNPLIKIEIEKGPFSATDLKQLFAKEPGYAVTMCLFANSNFVCMGSISLTIP